MLKLAIGAVVLYCGFVALLYVAQRSLQYLPERRRTAPRAIGLPEAEEAVLDTTDGERVIVWHVPPREGRPDAAAAYRARRGLGKPETFKFLRFTHICGAGAGREGLLRISRRADQLPAIAPLPPPRSYCRRRDRMGNIHGRNRNSRWLGLPCHKKEPQAVYAPWGLSLLPQLRLLYPAAGASGDVSRSVESYYFRY